MSRFSARLIRLSLTCGVLALLTPTAHAQDGADAPIDPEFLEIQRLFNSIEWTYGPATAPIGDNASIELTEGYQITGSAGSQAWNKITQNPPDSTVATLMPSDDESSWFIAFEFEDSGYVKDDEAADLDADAILKSMQQGTEASNKYRQQQGWGAIHVDGWIVEPTYDEETNHLVWATDLRADDGGRSANYSIRLLGRRGVMNAILVCDPEKMSEILPKVNQLLEGFEYNDGERYAQWTTGDKVAAYGLTGLITGGAFVAAAKTGLLAKLGMLLAKGGKAIVFVILAIGAGIYKLFGGRSSQAS
ncbi:DUF2167 domain-containing protein [Stratiformator vulcanicus]|uniref:DUF2167 domain-containing protein n=1 Tax=Stratiformator vulcanicus TaxID=2527980 RepID=A0A517QZH5_9PLAN|nr:DUF2167 domain-containing protein [Stratiformator vulcanicus]QDT37039.1 hypothetical protein Pan189_14050 [Stratiformator vulcanicus]